MCLLIYSVSFYLFLSTIYPLLRNVAEWVSLDLNKKFCPCFMFSFSVLKLSPALS